MGVKRKTRIVRKVKRSRFHKVVVIITKLTAAVFMIMLTAGLVMYFIDSDKTPFFGIFDRIFLEEKEETYKGNIFVNNSDELNAKHLGIERSLEKVIFDYFREKYKDFDTDIFVDIRYINAAFAGTFAVVEIEESIEIIEGVVFGGIHHVFDMRKANNKWRIVTHEERNGFETTEETEEHENNN